jgi:hypothetical protein
LNFAFDLIGLFVGHVTPTIVVIITTRDESDGIAIGIHKVAIFVNLDIAICHRLCEAFALHLLLRLDSFAYIVIFHQFLEVPF